jgi:hypothetical protein
VPDAHRWHAGTCDGIERELQPTRAKEQVAIGRDRRAHALEVRRDDRAIPSGKGCEQRTVASRIAAAAHREEHDTRRLLRVEHGDVERRHPVSHRHLPH